MSSRDRDHISRSRRGVWGKRDTTSTPYIRVDCMIIKGARGRKADRIDCGCNGRPDH